MWNCVQEIIYEKESCPIINYNAVKVYDRWTNKFFVYGGIRWPHNENKNSPTSRPNADFFCFRYYPAPRWKDYTKSMRMDDSLVSPFERTLTRQESMKLDLPSLGVLPALKNPIGTIVRDDTASKISYLLILGEPVGRQNDTYRHPLLLCINLVLNTWRFINLKRNHKVPNGRAYGSMIVAGEVRSTTSDLYLCLFGGINDTSKAYMDTFAVANLSTGSWVIPNGKIPTGPLGMRPGLAKLQTTEDGRDEVLIIRGALGPSHGDSITERATVTFSKAFLFNPRARLNQFSEIDVDTTRYPAPAKWFVSHAYDSEGSDEFVVVACGNQRALNGFPTRDSSAPNRVDIYVRPEMKIWIAAIREGGSEDREELHARGQVRAMDKEAEYRTDNDSFSDESSDSSSDDSDTRAARRSKFLAKRAVRSVPQHLRKSGKVLAWRNMTSGRVKRWLENLSGTFRVEAMILSGMISSQFDPSSCSINHSDFPRLILMGSDHAYLGEVRSDVYNAVAPISLHHLMEAEDDSTGTDVNRVLEDDHMSARSTEYEGSDAEILMEGLEDELRLSDEEIPAERAQSPVSSERSTLPPGDIQLHTTTRSIPDPRYFEGDDLDDDNVDYKVMFSSTGPDTFLLGQEAESEEANTADPEIESIVQNVMDTWDPSQNNVFETSSDIETEQMFQNPCWITA